MNSNKQLLTKKAIFLFFFAFIFSIQLFAQSISHGTDFYVAFGRNNQNNVPLVTDPNLNQPSSVELILRISATEKAEVSLSFKDNPSLDETFTVNAGAIYDKILSANQIIASYSGNSGASSKSIHVVSSTPIALIAVNTAYYNAGATLIWPSDSWGTEYYNVGLTPNGSITTTYANCNGYLIIAKENDTRITTYPLNSGTSSTQTLNEGDVFYFYSGSANTERYRFVSTKPVAFFNNNTQGSAGGGAYNFSFEQLAPVNQWGKEFILPNNWNNAGLYRIYTKDAAANIKITYVNSNGTAVTTGLPNVYISGYAAAQPNSNSVAIPAQRYSEIRIDGNQSNPTISSSIVAAYIQSDQPVAVCSYQIPRASSGLQMEKPEVAWLPPLEQRVESVLMNPLDINGKNISIKLYHYLMIIVPNTADKDKTTISINGADPVPIGSFPAATLRADATSINNYPYFNWISTDINGTGYSYGIFSFGFSNPTQNIYLRMNTLIENPGGLIALAYSNGSYTSYYYNAGSSYRDLTAGFTVNSIPYYKMDGATYCDVSDFTFASYGYPTDTLTDVRWILNGKEIPGSHNIKTITENNLPDGYYTAQMLSYNRTYTTHFFVGGSPVIWTPGANTEIEKTNWDNPANWMPAVVPTGCNNVFIPGNLGYYPKLSSAAICNKIYFMYGGELGRPDLLTYNKAFIQYNFGLSRSPVRINTNQNLILQSSSSNDRMTYSASVSATPIARDRWIMLSAPLKDIVTGDLSFGAFPLTFLRKFGPVNKDDIDYPVGNWTTSYNTMVEPVSSTGTDGFAFYIYGNNGLGGSDESNTFNYYNDLTYMPDRTGQYYGINQTNGVLELPFFADSTNLYAHRTQQYNQPTNKSTFFYVNDGSGSLADFNKITGKTETITRDANEGNYRFAPETYTGGAWSFQKNYLHPISSSLGDGDEFLVGNPYMSSIDMVKFFQDNPTSIYHSFRVWGSQNEFITCTLDDQSGVISSTDGSDMRYISPLQGFFLRSKGGGSVVFNVVNISTVRTKPAFNLRSDQETAVEKNLLRIKAENSYSTSYTVIGYKEGASNNYNPKEDVRKLFSPDNYVPSIYSLAGETPVDFNFINNNGTITIPLGMKTNRTGDTRLTFTGMNNYSQASKIEFIDASSNQTVDITGKSSYTYSFNNTKTGIQNGRFSLRISASITSLPDINSANDLKVYGDSKGIYVVSSEPVQRLEIYDFSGRKLYETKLNERYYPLSGNNISNSPLIVRVVTTNQVKTVKIE